MSSGLRDWPRSSLHDFLVGTVAVDGWDQRAGLPQIDGELPTVVIPVVQHHRAEKGEARNGPELSAAAHHPPGQRQVAVLHAGEMGPRPRHTVVEGSEDLGMAAGIGPGNRRLYVEGRLGRELRDGPGQV